ncbi:MAG: hypothetical protein J1E39_02060 [Eubacterium sp.]|nr:hypothetical protein [Eubacterium sp.]
MPNEIRVRVPQPVSLEVVIKTYLEKNEIGNKDIIAIFGNMGGDRVSKLKKLARTEMQKNGVLSWDANAVNTECAYQAWNIDVESVIKKFSRLKKLFGSETV